MNLVRSTFNEDDADDILHLPIGGIGQNDILSWNYIANECYTIRSEYWVARKLGEGSTIGGTSATSQSWWCNI